MAQQDFLEAVLETHFESVDMEVEQLTAENLTAAFTAPAPAGETRVNSENLRQLLARDNFALDCNCPATQTIIYVRPSFAPGLQESITIQSAGRRGQVVQARVGVWFGVHGIVAGESRPLLSTGSSTGILLLRDAGHARATETRIAATGPRAAATLARAKGPTILTRLGAARRAAQEYLALLGPPRPAREILLDLLSRATPDQRTAARMLLDFPGVLRIDRPQLYHIAALALTLFGPQVERLEPPFRTATLRGAPMVTRLQLLVHYLDGAT